MKRADARQVSEILCRYQDRNKINVTIKIKIKIKNVKGAWGICG